MATFTVTTLGDETNLNDDETTLREAIAAANILPGSDVIVLDTDEVDQRFPPFRIELTEGPIRVDEAITITAAYPLIDLYIFDTGNPVLLIDSGKESTAFTGPAAGDNPVNDEYVSVIEYFEPGVSFGFSGLSFDRFDVLDLTSLNGVGLEEIRYI